MAEEVSIVKREAQIVAAMEIGKLNFKHKQRLNVDKEVIFQLILMLQAQDHQSIEAALSALLNLAFGSERHKFCIAKCGAVPAIVEILRCREGSLLELAVATLLVLSSCTANKPDIVASGAVHALFQLLEPQFLAKIDVVSTLHNLSTSPLMILSILVSDCLIYLVRLIYSSEKSSELAEKAIGLLESLVSTSDVALNKVCETEGAIGMLVEAVEEGTGPCKEHEAGILVLICRSSKERYKAMILSEGATPGLLQLSVDGTRRAREEAKALLLLLRSNPNATSNHSRNALLEEVMTEIDRLRHPFTLWRKLLPNLGHEMIISYVIFVI